MTMATMSITDLRQRMGELLQRVRKQPVVVTRRGRPQAVIIDYEQYKAMTAKLESMATDTQAKSKVQLLIEEMQDKYAQYPSFTQALLAERAREREREAHILRSG